MREPTVEPTNRFGSFSVPNAKYGDKLSSFSLDKTKISLRGQLHVVRKNEIQLHFVTAELLN